MNFTSVIHWSPRADPGGVAHLRNDVTDGEVKKNLKANKYTRRKKLHLRGVRTPCTLPLDPSLVTQINCKAKLVG